jgi:hypothetical protein
MIAVNDAVMHVGAQHSWFRITNGDLGKASGPFQAHSHQPRAYVKIALCVASVADREEFAGG